MFFLKALIAKLVRKIGKEINFRAFVENDKKGHKIKT